MGRESQTIVGRTLLKDAIEQLNHREKQNVLLIKGPSGIGKTYAVTYFLDQNPNLKVVACKQHNQYIAEFTLIRALVDELMHYILVLPTKIFNPLVYLIRNSLTKELPYIGYFSSILPKVFEDVKIKQSIDYPRQKYKIRKAINNFVKLVCSQLDHVYIHFDDLQWADENALDIVKGLLKDKTIGANFILSYRDDFNGLFKEEKSYDVFLLSPFTLDEVKEIIDKK